MTLMALDRNMSHFESLREVTLATAGLTDPGVVCVLDGSQTLVIASDAFLHQTVLLFTLFVQTDLVDRIYSFINTYGCDCVHCVNL